MRWLLFALLCLPPLCRGQLGAIVDGWKQAKSLQGASIGFCVLDAATGTLVAEYNARQQLVPASTLKVVTTTAALGLLGGNFRYETKLLYSGELDTHSGVLNGDLVILGSGDPSLQSAYFLRDSNSVTDTWAAVLKQKGLREIRGRIVADASCFQHRVPPDWIWGDIGNYFGAVPCGLSFNDNKFSIVYASGAAGSTASVTGVYPNYLNRTLTVSSSVTARGSQNEAYVFGDPFGYAKEVRGTIPPNKTNYAVEAALPDPALLCAEALWRSLKKQGIVCPQNSLVTTYTAAPPAAPRRLMYTHYSPLLDNLVLYTNLKSDNLYCESLLLTLGNGDRENGVNAVKNYWQQRGLDVSQLYMADGSGLSRANTLSPYFQSQLLSKMYRDSLHYRAFDASLPRAGKNGSMANVGRGTGIENNLRAKTGYINRVRGYCGYLRTKTGRQLCFSVLLNHYNCSAKEAKFELEKFMVALSDL